VFVTLYVNCTGLYCCVWIVDLYVQIFTIQCYMISCLKNLFGVFFKITDLAINPLFLAIARTPFLWHGFMLFGTNTGYIGCMCSIYRYVLLLLTGISQPMSTRLKLSHRCIISQLLQPQSHQKKTDDEMSEDGVSSAA